MNLRRNFCSNVAHIYRIHRKSLTAFAEELDISRSSLQEIRKGSSNPTLDTVEHIANNLGLNPLLLLFPLGSPKQMEIENMLLQLAQLLTGLSDQQKQKLAPHFYAIIHILLEEREE